LARAYKHLARLFYVCFPDVDTVAGRCPDDATTGATSTPGGERRCSTVMSAGGIDGDARRRVLDHQLRGWCGGPDRPVAGDDLSDAPSVEATSWEVVYEFLAGERRGVVT